MAALTPTKESRRAIVIDDDATLAEIFARVITRCGWHADSCHSVAEAAESFKRQPYSLALCDIDLPDGDGVFLARALLSVSPRLLVVMTSGEPDNIARAREAGFRHCLQKPFSLDELTILLDRQSTP